MNFERGLLVKDTYILYLLPKKVQGEDLTLNYFQKMLENQRKKSKVPPAQYGYTNRFVMEQFGGIPNQTSCWLLLRKEVIPMSRGKSFDLQSKMGHSIPKILEVTVGILTHYVAKGERIFSNHPEITFTRCEEATGKEHHVVVGSFDSTGLCIDDTNRNFEIFGMTDLRKLSPSIQ